MNRLLKFLCSTLCIVISSCNTGDVALTERWSPEHAWDWYNNQPWMVGCNFIPSNAINQLEMWLQETFDPETIDRELAYAEGIGMNVVRVYLHNLAYGQDPWGFEARIDTFLTIADRHGLKAVFVLFDDCWNDDPQIGRQPEPIPGVHNSGWVQSPGTRIVNDSSSWKAIEDYVKGVIATFGRDQRIAFWDLYNEPGNGGQDLRSFYLLRATFAWARDMAPSQPLTAGIWYDNEELNKLQLEASDIITFHNYNDSLNLVAQIAELKSYGRPLICTEWLRRTGNSLPQTHLPIFKRENVGCINWGLVSGKTQTIYPWESKEGAPEPELWFHDLFRADGTPFDEHELETFRSLTGHQQP